MRRCSICVHKEVCKFLPAEYLLHFSEAGVFHLMDEIEKMEIELATRCRDYAERHH